MHDAGVIDGEATVKVILGLECDGGVAACELPVGEVVGVAVVPKMPCSLSLAEMRRFAQDQGIAPMWLPEALVFIDAVPKGATGKPARIGLAKRLNVEEIGGPPAKGESVALSIGNSAVYHDSISLSANQERKAVRTLLACWLRAGMLRALPPNLI